MTRVLWFHPRSLLPARGGGEVRVNGLINAVLGAGHEVLVVQPGPLGAGQPDGFRVIEAPVRQGIGLAVAKVTSRSPLRTARLTWNSRWVVKREIRSFAPNLSVVSDALSWSIASALLPDVPWIFDAHNVETELFREMSRNASTIFDRLTLAVDRRRIAHQEPDIVNRADAVITVSRNDADSLVRLGRQGRPPVVVPSSVPTPPQARPPVTDAVVLFVGTLDYPPNVEAVTELATRLMPRIREKLRARLRVVGRQPTAALRAVLAHEWIDFIEDAPRVETHYRAARCVVLPIRSGGGSRLKVYEALSYGVPIVGTTRAMSGIDLPNGRGAMVADSEDALVSSTVRVLTEDPLALKLGEAGRDWFLDKLSWDSASRPLLTLIDELT